MVSELPIVMISFETNGQNGGPYTSHKRIMESNLAQSYFFEPLMLKSKKEAGRLKRVIDLVSQIKKSNPDIIHIHGLQMAGFYFAIAAKIARKPFILAVHGSTSEALYCNRLIKSIIHIFEVLTIKMSAKVYCVSNYACNLNIVKKYGKNKLFGTIYNLPEVKNLKYDRPAIRRELGIDNEVTVITTGRITLEKGYDVFCNSIINMKEYENIKFIVAGNGDYLNTFQSRIADAGLSERVMFLGYVHDVHKYYIASDIFMICTKHETLCNALIEAGAVGLPLLASNVGGIPEIIEDEVNGLLADWKNANDFTDKLEKLVLNPELRKNYGEQIKKTIKKKFDENTAVSQLAELYRGVLHDKTKK